MLLSLHIIIKAFLKVLPSWEIQVQQKSQRSVTGVFSSWKWNKFYSEKSDEDWKKESQLSCNYEYSSFQEKYIFMGIIN